jgi:hypothetical protein
MGDLTRMFILECFSTREKKEPGVIWIKSMSFSLTCDEYIYVSNPHPLTEVEITLLVYWTRQGP